MGAVPPRLSVVSMGVPDVAATTDFFRRLGWPISTLSTPEVAWVRTADSTVGIYSLNVLAAEAAAEPVVPVVTFAVDLESPTDVDRAADEAIRSGAELIEPPRAEDWGGVAAYVRIPGGYVWEYTYNPFVAFGPDGRTLFP